ncbi:MAG: SEC-C metal-binding domain-containing protein [Patescibacteria group bacterium]
MKISRTVSLTQSKVGRNDPCPCGSGNKYKKCCLGKDTSLLPPAPLKKAEFIRPLTDWATSQEWYRELFMRIFKETLDRKPGGHILEDEAQGLSEVILFEGKTKTGKTPLELYTETLTKEASVLNLYTRWIKEQQFGIWQVLEVYLGRGMKIASSQKKQLYLVAERMGSFSIKPGNMVVARILPVDDHWIFGGGLMAILPKTSEYISYLSPKQLSITGKDFLTVWHGKKDSGVEDSQKETRSYEDLKKELFSFAKKEELPLDEVDFDLRFKQAKHPLVFFHSLLIIALEQPKNEEKLNQIIQELWMLVHVNKNRGTAFDKGPVEEMLIRECSRELGKVVEAEDITVPEKQIQHSKVFIKNWLDRPRKKFGYKTAREVIVGERKQHGNPDTKIEYNSVLIYWSKRWDAAWKLHEQGFKVMRTQQFTKAIHLFNQVLNLYPDFPIKFRTLANLGMSLVAAGDLEAGKIKLQEALKVNPNYRFARERLEELSKRTAKQIMEEMTMLNLQKKLKRVVAKTQHHSRKIRGRWVLKKGS